MSRRLPIYYLLKEYSIFRTKFYRGRATERMRTTAIEDAGGGFAC